MYMSVRLSRGLTMISLLLIIRSIYLLAVYRNRPQGTDHFGYAFYATSDNYACSALVNIHRLCFLFHTKFPIYLLTTTAVSQAFKETAKERYDVTVIEHAPPPLAVGGAPYYRDVLLKLVRPLDEIFTQIPPGVEVAGAHAYWLTDEPVATSAMIMVSPSEPLWERMNSSLASVMQDQYDMDLINSMFRREIMLLPGNYVTLNSHWETNELPVWSRYRRVSPEEPPDRHSVMNTTVPDEPSSPRGGSALEGTRTQMIGTSTTSTVNTQTAFGNSEALIPYDPGVVDPLTSIFNENVYILHFTALGKPWSYTVEGVMRQRPKAHPLFAQQFLLWRVAARHVCPVFDGLDVA
ncbi:uncharacterized protein A1O9_12964 [Exophiala aquamarina CBS 119918]|uniref:Uncharacterized protein n=1 Tax=Exophiala aquamarina CBS 119918 TaxID=1182545 RepID=A0A072NUD8_9EURO|nr:uncharacterized protein A1O9_12964 [Exophiala aquamarina CBS 119918]KEF50987.1 hypothetical protein A1O9_12964 [Exophiala aquamarina CBS 119918]